MKRFLAKIALGTALTLVSFVALAVAARFVPSLNWFFFQKNEHDRVFYTLLEAEKALAANQHFDVLIFGSSTCENAIDPEKFTAATGLSVFKFVTGAQTIDMSAAVARFLAPRFQPKYVIIDAYPRYGGGLTEEGVERAVINSPVATSALTRAILAVDASSLTTDYLWAARAIGTSVKPYDQTSIIPKPGEFEMLAPGFSRTVVDPPAKAGPFEVTPVPRPAVDCMNALSDDLAKTGQRLVVIVPPLQNAEIRFEDATKFPLIVPQPRPDTCFFDNRHMRGVCVPGYTQEIADRFNAFRKSEAASEN